MKITAALTTLLMLSSVQASLFHKKPKQSKKDVGICYDGINSVLAPDDFKTNFSVERFAFSGTYECHGQTPICFNMKGDNVFYYYTGIDFGNIAWKSPDGKCTADYANQRIVCHA
ncbi:uncharacterized protein UTRI_02982 [Ustilago trichophora]|uniref:Mig1 protein n=1 Tax=Ustilago trichophora TaxID=86804 RepID=A0A5C3ER27_9BASI|nr:uncharacterized protein UTRI_02982 [Ustilago trichophora]